MEYRRVCVYVSVSLCGNMTMNVLKRINPGCMDNKTSRQHTFLFISMTNIESYIQIVITLNPLSIYS